jgi:rsbT co-antagonist protein RsbR
MLTAAKSRIAQVLEDHEMELLAEWQREMAASGAGRGDLIKQSELAEQCSEFIKLVRDATASNGEGADVDSPSWASVREFLAGVSRARAIQGFSPTETATFVFSFKKPLFARLRSAIGKSGSNGKEGDALATELWTATEIFDRLAMLTSEEFQKSREELIKRQQQDMLELSTPVVKLWDGILALPMIGTLDSARTQVVMETLLQKIVETGAEIAIIDITGVPTVDTLVAQHLLKTVTAARLMGADCIISGIRPQIAQTIVHLGVNLTDVITKATMADAFVLALRRLGYTAVKAAAVAAVAKV